MSNNDDHYHTPPHFKCTMNVPLITRSFHALALLHAVTPPTLQPINSNASSTVSRNNFVNVSPPYFKCTMNVPLITRSFHALALLHARSPHPPFNQSIQTPRQLLLVTTLNTDQSNDETIKLSSSFAQFKFIRV